MAKSTGYFGLRHGSTKSHTFQVVGGQQITKDRVEGGKNPRTPLQMRQRCVIATCAQAYKAMKAICGHAFEGVSEGRDCAMKFRERNTRQLMFAANGQNESFGFNKWGVKGMMPGSYILSDGNLDQPLPNMYVASVNANSKQIVISAALGLNNTEILQDFGFEQFDDIVTICVAYPKTDGTYGFGAVRFTYKQGEDLQGSLELAKIGDIASASFAVVSNELKLTIVTNNNWATDAAVADVLSAAIASQKRNGKWLRSKAQFSIDNAAPSYDEAIATYPVGEQPFMNGSGETSQSSQSSSSSSGSSGSSNSSSSGSNGSSGSSSGTSETPETLSAPTISGNTTFSESAEVSISAADGAEIRYTTDGSTPTASSTLYSEAFTVTETTSVKAIAIKEGQTSEVASKTFVKSSGEGGMDQN